MAMFRILICGMVLCMGCQTAENLELRPNILLILVDDMGYGDLSIAGNIDIQTPHLDGLAQESVRFKYFYVSPVCAPTRASLLTGKYHQRVGVRSVTNGYEILVPSEVTLAELLKEHGYRTGLFGKWHLGEYYPSTPLAQGFDEFLGFRTGHTAEYYNATLEHNDALEETRGYITDVLTNMALAFMEEAVNQDPFFCYLSYNAPHSPLQVDSSRFLPFIEKGLIDKTARVYAMVEQLDANIGRILSRLEQDDLLEKTVVIFMSDNGPISGWGIEQEAMRFNSGLRDQKFTAYEGGIRTQSYWMWQEHWEPYYDTLSIAAHIDVFPTLASLAGITVPESLAIDGLDLRFALENHSVVDTSRIYFEDFSYEAVRNPGLFIGGIARQYQWKMRAGKELYDLWSDPGEVHDVSSQFPDVLQRLSEAYENYYDYIFKNGLGHPRPIEVGHKEENPVYIKAHHGIAAGNVQFVGYRGHNNERTGVHPVGVDGDWTSNWRTKGDAMTWTVNFLQPNKTYEIGISVQGDFQMDIVNLKLQVGSQEKVIRLSGISEEGRWSDQTIMRGEFFGVQEVKIELKESVPADSLKIGALVIGML